MSTEPGWTIAGLPAPAPDRARARVVIAVAAAIASAGAITACGPPASPASSAGSGTSASAAAESLATSLAGTRDVWAVLPVSAGAFWQLFVRPAESATWKLVTPPGVASDGGLVAASAGRSLIVAVRPSQNLAFSPLASTANAGTTWFTGDPLSTGVAASPGALAADGDRRLAVLGDGTIETSANAGSSWQTLARPGAITASPAGRGCGPLAVTSVTFGATGSEVLAGGSCGTSGAAALFSYPPSGRWQRLSLPVSGQLVRFTAGLALLRAKAGLTALWDVAAGWTASAPLPVTGPVTASGGLAGGGAWVLLPGGRAATIGGIGQQWLPLPPLPATTSVLASGPNGALDALAVSGPALTVWRLARASTVWTKIQVINVPVQDGASS